MCVWFRKRGFTLPCLCVILIHLACFACALIFYSSYVHVHSWEDEEGKNKDKDEGEDDKDKDENKLKNVKKKIYR